MLRAILVDDEDLSVRMLESIVDWRRYGVEITATARSGKDALRLFSELRPELMVTDIRMPGMDGIELLRCVKEMEPRTEFILVSALWIGSFREWMQKRPICRWGARTICSNRWMNLNWNGQSKKSQTR